MHCRIPEVGEWVDVCADGQYFLCVELEQQFGEIQFCIFAFIGDVTKFRCAFDRAADADMRKSEEAVFWGVA